MNPVSRPGPQGHELHNFQLLALALMNVIFLAVGCSLLRFAYSPGPHTQPMGFWGIEIAIVVLSLFTVASSASGWAMVDSLLGAWAPAGLQKRLRESVTSPLKVTAVALLTIGNFAPFCWLVWHTGGMKTSPFTPLVTVPALFSPFLAKRPSSIVILALLGAAAFGVMTAVGPEHDGTQTAHPYAFAVVAVVIMAVAALLSAAKTATGVRVSTDIDGGAA